MQRDGFLLNVPFVRDVRVDSERGSDVGPLLLGGEAVEEGTDVMS
jgi:hypothetical protein